jgi:uncharacterized protein (DUF433 family)
MPGTCNLPAWVGRGIYTFAEAALYARITARRARAWFTGPARLFTPDFPPLDGDTSISFLDLVELAVAAHLARLGRSKAEIRAIRAGLPGSSHPFAHSDATGRVPARRLFRQFDYPHGGGLAGRWRIAPGVILSPGHRFGAPIGETCYISTRCLAGPVGAGDGAGAVAEWYGIDAESVRQAVAFEREMARRARA